jgi:hypothetical protein
MYVCTSAKLMGLISVDFDTVHELLIKFSVSDTYGNTVRENFSHLQISRKT